MSVKSYKKKSRIIAPPKRETAEPTYQERTERKKMWLDFVVKLSLVAAMLWLKLDEMLLGIPFIGDLIKIFWKKKGE